MCILTAWENLQEKIHLICAIKLKAWTACEKTKALCKNDEVTEKWNYVHTLKSNIKCKMM
jgi:hypothetical protein